MKQNVEPEYELPVAKSEKLPHGGRKFTTAEVYELRRKYRNGDSFRILAVDRGVSIPCVVAAIRGTGAYSEK